MYTYKCIISYIIVDWIRVCVCIYAFPYSNWKRKNKRA